MAKVTIVQRDSLGNITSSNEVDEPADVQATALASSQLLSRLRQMRTIQATLDADLATVDTVTTVAALRTLLKRSMTMLRYSLEVEERLMFLLGVRRDDL